MLQWRHTVVKWDNALGRLVSSDLLDVRFSSRREGQDVLNVAFSFNCYEV